MKQWIKSAAFFCLYYSGLERLLATLLRIDGVAVLMYHGVCDDAPMPPAINFHLEPEIFERQMRVLKSRYRVVPLSDVTRALSQGKRLEKAVVLTFDDGYRNNALRVAPILKRMGLPFTVFVATSYVDTGRWMPLNEIYWMWSMGELGSEEMAALRKQVRGRPWQEVRQAVDAVRNRRQTPATTAAEESFAMLNWDEIHRMAADGVGFGSHTHSHCNMAVESSERQTSELLASRELLEKHLEHPVRSFAYPYGRAEHMSEVSRRNVIKAGYECAISGEYGLVTSRSDRFRLPRLGYNRRIWIFAGEIFYQLAKQAAKDAWKSFAGRAVVEETERRHG